MERDKTEKRKREDDDIINHSKKQEYNCIHGVFYFPWLKEGVVFKGDDDYLDEHDDKFSPCSYEDFEQLSSLNLCDSPTLEANFYETKLDDEGFWPLLVDDLEPIDGIWNCVIDQPLDMGFNKGL